MESQPSHDAALRQLTPRQREALRYVYQRRTTKEIAPMMALAAGTVDKYLNDATSALGARNRRHASEILHDFEAGKSSPGKLEPDKTGIENEPGRPVAPSARREQRHWAAMLPFRQKGALGNDLGPLARLVTIVGLAIAFSIGFGMLAVGMRVISDLATKFR